MPERIVPVILAAGRSRRMGRAKPLLPLGGRTVLQQVVSALAAAGLAKPIVVLGPDGEPVAASLRNDPVSLAWNLAPESDMGDSLRTALAHLGTGRDGVMVCLGDQPLVTPATYRLLAEAFLAFPDRIIQPRRSGRRGHPVLLPVPVFAEVRRRPTLRDLLAAHLASVRLVDVDDPGVLLDMDTPDDYERVRRLWAAQAG